MSGVRVLVGTRKGAFILTSDERRANWEVCGPHFPGWEVYHLHGSPVDQNRLYASQSSGWMGQLIQRSDDGGHTWREVGKDFSYEGQPGTHLWYDGSKHPWEFTRVWHLEPSLDDPDTVYAGVEDAALFRSTDGGQSWQELAALRDVSSELWMPGAGGMCLHSILLDPSNPKRIVVAISAAGVFRTDDGGTSWQPATGGLTANWDLTDPKGEVGFCVHDIAMHPSRPDTLFLQNHNGIFRTDDAGSCWRNISGNLPSDFGFPVTIHPYEPETAYVVPITSEVLHYPPEAKLRVYRNRKGGDEWEALTHGLPQEDCYVNVLRDAMSVDRLESAGVYFGTTGGQVYASANGGDSWETIVRDLPSVVSIEVQTLP